MLLVPGCRTTYLAANHHAACQFPDILFAIYHQFATDQHLFDPLAVTMGLKGIRAVVQPLRVKDDQVGKVICLDLPAPGKAETPGRQAGHLVDRLGQGHQLLVPHQFPE